MRQSEFLRIQDQQIRAYTTQMSAMIEELGTLSSELHGHSGEVYSALWTLQSDMEGIDGKIGTDENADKVRHNWNQAYPQVQEIFRATARGITTIADGISRSADMLLAAENETLQGFGRRAVDPRPRPPAPRPGRFIE